MSIDYDVITHESQGGGGGGCVLKNPNVSNFVSSPSFFLWKLLHMI